MEISDSPNDDDEEETVGLIRGVRGGSAVTPIRTDSNANTLAWKVSALALLSGCLFVLNSLGVIGLKGFVTGAKSKFENPRMSPSIRTEHSVCFSKDLIGGDSGNSLDGNNIGVWDGSWVERAVVRAGEYVRIGRDVARPVRYTHLCPRIKPRYNCARNDTSSYEYGDAATDWKLILRPSGQRQQEGETCNLWEFASALGGPVGLAEYLLSKKNEETSSNSSSADAKRMMITVLMSGDSLLRQVFEALACGFEDDVSDLRLQKHKHDEDFKISIVGLEKRGINAHTNKAEEWAQKFTTAEAGEFERPPDPETGTCRPNANISMYYESGVALPLECYYGSEDKRDRYGDNLAMVEFGGKIRFYYVFRPFIYANLTDVFRSKMGLDPREVDAIVFNSGSARLVERDYPDLLDVFHQTGAWQSKITAWPFHQFKGKQSENIGRYFGADNPWIDSPPDLHACMPGMPDDEANMLLLWMMLQQEQKNEQKLE